MNPISGPASPAPADAVTLRVIAQVGEPAVRGTPAEIDVGAVLQRMDVDRQLGDVELEEHIAGCRSLMERAYARFLEHGNPADRDEAVLWMHHRDRALTQRRQEVKDAMHTEIQRRIEAENAGYFIDAGDRDRAALAGRAA